METVKKLSVLFVTFLLMTAVKTLADDSEDVQKDDEVAEDATKNDVDKEEGVLVLTDANFDDVTDDHDFFLAEFYAPWCGHCKTLAPEYSKAANQLQEAGIPVALGKVDATVHTDIGQRFNVEGYPTLKFKQDGSWIDYEGQRSAEGIVSWVSERADPNYKPPPETVVMVTTDTFDEFINSAELVLVEFYAPWCGHCKRLAPEYEKAAKQLINHDPPILLGKVDATVETEIAQRFGVTGYPTMKMFRNGRASDYTGGRDTFGIVDHMRKHSGEAAHLLPSVGQVKAMISKERASVIGFFDNLEDKNLRTYMNVANDRREDLAFGYTLLPEAREPFKVNPGTVVVFNPEKFWTKFEKKYNILKLEGKTEDDIAAFIKENELPLVAEYSAQTSKFYDEYQKKTLCVAFYTVDWSFDHKEATQVWRKKIANIAKEHKDIKFAVANEEDFISSMMKEVGLDDSPEELNIGCVSDGRKYRMEPMDEFEEDEVHEFLNKLKKGKISPQIKSQPVPKKNTGPVKVVVGKTFDKIVLDKTKDVLIEFYAPWCGHCKNLDPIYKELGKSLKKEKNLVIAKLDATANDIPESYKVEGFPTIYFAPAKDKKNPLKYEGDRTLEGFTKYLQEKATVSLGANLKDEL